MSDSVRVREGGTARPPVLKIERTPRTAATMGRAMYALPRSDLR
jgi:hypothetical protein